MTLFAKLFPMNWRAIQKQNITKWSELVEFLQLTPEQQAQTNANPSFVLNLPVRLAHKIPKSTLEDPILRQFLPTQQELKTLPGFVADPVGDSFARKQSRLLHKYQGRVLLITTSACAMHCRYCFRQNFDYSSGDFTKEIEYIQNDPTIREVILSGGDPLSLSNQVLGNLLAGLSKIPHIKHIRFHTRFPIGIPERIDEEFIEMLTTFPQQVWFVIHCNHPHELDQDIFDALHQLQKRGVHLLNQAVLLKGVNDNVETLQELCETLSDHGVIPYYLHQLDRVQGAAHFEVAEETGLELIHQLRSRLPGYQVPHYVREIAGEPSKTPVSFLGEHHKSC